MGLKVSTVGLGLILLLLEARETLGGAHSLCLNLTVRAQASPGQPWYEAQGSVNGKPFLQYDSDSGKATPLGLLGEEVKDTTAWADLTHTLEDVGRELRMFLLVTKLEENLIRGPSILKARLCCQREARQCTGASWEFSINEQTMIIDTKRMKWTLVDPGARGFKQQWESNRDMAEHLRMVSAADCNHWLKEFLGLWETALGPTAPLLRGAGETQSSPSTLLPVWIIPTIFICLVLMFL